MTIYLDTSAFVKLYINEKESADIRAMVNQATEKTTSLITYVEARSALARRRRERSYSKAFEQTLVDKLDANWDDYIVFPVTEPLVHQAGELAAKHYLRAYDALHLASALELQTKLKRPVTFAAFDAPLVKAARKEKLLTLS